MASIANLVHETSSSTGTGNFTLVAANGKQSFNDAFGTGGTDLFYYYISSQDAAEWEHGTGHLSDATTLVRDTVIESSNADAAVNFSAGTKDVTNDLPAGIIAGGVVHNHLINGDFQIAQRGTSFDSTTVFPNSDDTYLLDRWNLLSDGNDVVDVSQETSVVPTNQLFAIKLDIETANKKAGIVQFIEQRDCVGLIGETVTLSFKARKGASNATVDKLRCAILAWDGTADTLTSDVVSAWNAEGADPTMVANWTIENTPADLTLTDSYQTFTATAAVDTSGAKNVAVFIWIDNSDGTVGDLVYITDVQLEEGAVANAFHHPTIAEEYARCLRYFQRYGAANSAIGFSGYVGSGADYLIGTMFFPPMRVTPTATKRGTWVSTNCGEPTATGIRPNSAQVAAQGDAAGYAVFYTDSADDIVDLSAEL